jgi:hypothetical protein
VQLGFNGTGSGVNGCPSVHEDVDSGEVIVHGPPLTDPDDIDQLRHLNEGEVPIVVPRELLVDFGPKEVHRVPNILDLDEFDRLFTQFAHTAWRLETRRRYASDELTDTYAQFTRGEAVNWDGVDAEWCAERREQTALGKRFERVRAAADRALLPAEDFWLFDSRLVARLNFDGDDQLLNVELITEPAAVMRYAQARDAAMHHAVPYDEFAAQLPGKE